MTMKKTVVLRARVGANQVQFLVDKVADNIFAYAAQCISNRSNH